MSQEEIDNFITQSQIEIVAHPAAFRERWWRKDDGTLVGPFPSPPRKEWEATGAKIVNSEKSYKLDQDCWTTGYIPRRRIEKSGRPTQLL